jgi:hypothetical protein
MSTEHSAPGSAFSRSVFLWCLWFLITWTVATFLMGFLAKLMPLVLLFGFTAPVAFLALVAAVVGWARWKVRPRRWLALVGLLICPLLVTTMLFTHWPMKLSFALSKPALDRMADAVAAHRAPALPKRAGAYVIHAVETRPVAEGANGLTVCLWMLPLERQHVGFVRSPAGVTPKFNPWTHSRMDVNWHYFGED